MDNFSGEFFGILDEARTYRLVLTVVLVAVVVWWWGPKALRKDDGAADRATRL